MEKQEHEAKRAESSPDREAIPQDDSPQGSSRSWVEVLLDPRTLQGLMSCGAGLLVLGLVTWLWSIGIFENKLIVATSLGVANFVLLALGVAGTRYSRYKTASRAVTLLGCLVMPLNLWFYDAQGIITLDQGGHLWVPALVCCVLYVLVARVLADPVFVHAIVGGVTMMGLLILADHRVDRLWEIMAPSSFLVILGVFCVHIERAFPPEEGPFSRSNFGRAFFNAGHVLMGIGLSVLLVGRVVGRLYERFFVGVAWLTQPEVATQANLKLIAIALVVGATYTYVYSQLVVRPQRRYLRFALATFVWAAILVLDLLQVSLTIELIMLFSASLALVANLIDRLCQESTIEQRESSRLTSMVASAKQATSGWSRGLNYLTLGLGLLIWCGVRLGLTDLVSSRQFGILFPTASLIGAVSYWYSRSSKESSKAISSRMWHLQAGVVLLWFASDSLLSLLGFQLNVFALLLQVLLPLGLAFGACLTSEETRRRMLALSAETVGSLILLVAVGGLWGLFVGVSMAGPQIALATLFAGVSLCLGLSSRVSERLLPAALAALSLCGATWQFFLVLGITNYVFVHTLAAIGLVCLVVSFITRNDRAANQLSVVTKWTGRLCVSTAGAATLLISLARLVSNESGWSVLGLVSAQVVVAGMAGLLSKESTWRRHFFVLASGQTLMALLVYNMHTSLSFWQRTEIFLTCLGLVALGLGYLGWSRETDAEDDLVSFNLAIGSFLSSVPLSIGMLVQRFDSKVADWGWGLIHEAGVLSIGLLLLGAGVLCRIRWSTMVGGATLLVYVGSLVGLVRVPAQLQSTAVYMMVGGGLFFGAALLLSVYRDRLLSIPNRMQNGEGVFRVLKWR